MKLLKSIVFPLLFVVAYSILIATVFFGSGSLSELGTTIGLQIILIVLGFLAIQTIPYEYKNRLYGLRIVLGLIRGSIAFFTHSTQHAVFLVCTHAIFLIYTRSWYSLISSSKTYYLWRSAHRGLNLISIALAFTYAATLWTASTGLQLNCNDLKNQTIGTITRYIPSSAQSPFLTNLAQKIDTIGSQTFGQLLGTTLPSHLDTGTIVLPKNISNNPSTITTSPIPYSPTGTIIPLYTLNLNTDMLSGTVSSGQIASVVQGLLSGTAIVTGSQYSGLMVGLLNYQQQLLNGILNNQKFIDGQVCSVTLSHITDLIRQGEIKIIGFIFLVLFLSLFMRSIMFILGIINYIIIFILYGLGRFRITTKTEECEQIEV